jgi:hypothetical protein
MTLRATNSENAPTAAAPSTATALTTIAVVPMALPAPIFRPARELLGFAIRQHLVLGGCSPTETASLTTVILKKA